MAKSIFDYMSKEDYDEYNAIQERATAAKAEAPKPKREHKPMSIEAKIAMTEKRKAALEAKVAALLAAQQQQTTDAATTDGE